MGGYIPVIQERGKYEDRCLSLCKHEQHSGQFKQDEQRHRPGDVVKYEMDIDREQLLVYDFEKSEITFGERGRLVNNEYFKGLC